MTHPTQPDPFQQQDLWSHPDKPVMDLVAVRGVCMRLRPLDAPVRPGEPCGQIHTRCAGHVRAKHPDRAIRRGDPCPVKALDGGTVCRHHNAHNDKADREQIVSTKKAIQVCNLFGIPVDIDPIEALAKDLARWEGHVEALEVQLQKCAADEFSWGLAEHRFGFGPEGPVDVKTYRAAAPVLYDMWRAGCAHLVKVAAECVKAGVDVVMTRLAVEAGQREAEMLRIFAQRMGIDMDAPETRQAVEHTLTVIDGGAAA